MNVLRKMGKTTPLLALGFGLLAATLYGQAAADYASSVPTVEADRSLQFTWVDVDKYPVITAMAFLTGQTRMITGGDDCQLCVWDLTNGTLTSHFAAHEDWVRGVAVSPDGTIIASIGQNGTVKLWNGADLKLKSTFADKVVGAQGIAFSPDGKRLAVCGFDNYVAIFDLNGSSLVGKWKMPGTSNTAVRYSPDGKLLAAVGRDGKVRVWETDSMKVLFDLTSSDRRVYDLAFNTDGRLLAAGGEDSAITVWDTESGATAARFETGVGKTFSLCFCGSYLASGDSLNTIRLWSLKSGKEVARCFGHTGTVAVMEFHPEKNELSSAGFDTTVRFWPLGEIAK